MVDPRQERKPGHFELRAVNLDGTERDGNRAPGLGLMPLFNVGGADYEAERRKAVFRGAAVDFLDFGEQVSEAESGDFHLHGRLSIRGWPGAGLRCGKATYTPAFRRWSTVIRTVAVIFL
jgi:hypothetical protein